MAMNTRRSTFRLMIFGNQYYRYDDTYLPYHDGEIEYDGKYYDVMDGGDYGVTMYFDEDNGWLTELP